MYRAMGFAHASAYHHLQRARRQQDGQGTVEYIGLILLLAAVMAVVSTKANGSSIGNTVITKIKDSIDGIAKS